MEASESKGSGRRESLKGRALWSKRHDLNQSPSRNPSWKFQELLWLHSTSRRVQLCTAGLLWNSDIDTGVSMGRITSPSMRRESDKLTRVCVFIIRLGNGRYISKCVLTSNYLDFESARAREQAFPLNDFDSALVLRTLKLKGQQATRYEVESGHPKSGQALLK